MHTIMKIPVGIYQRTKKLCVAVQPKNTCKLKFVNNLRLPFLDQPQSGIVAFRNNYISNI